LLIVLKICLDVAAHVKQHSLDRPSQPGEETGRSCRQ
jgi:hypothetical protein